MVEFSIVLSYCSIIALVVGLFSPKRSLFWYHGKKSSVNSVMIYVILLVLSFLLFAVSENVT